MAAVSQDKGGGARRAKEAQAPVNETVLRSFEKSAAANNVMVKRIISALRRAWNERADFEDRLWREQDERRVENEKRTKQEVLVVVHVDGWVEVYADAGASVGTLELSIVDSEDESDWKAKVPHSKRHLLELKPTTCAFPRYLNRPNQFTDESFVRVLEYMNRIERDQRISEWAQEALKRSKQ